MLKHYINIAIRNIIKEKYYSLLNIFGLAVGFACFIIISLYIYKETKVDGSMPNAENIYRVGIDADIPSMDIQGKTVYTNSGFSWYINNEAEWAECATSFAGNWEGLISNKINAFEESGLYMVDSNFFKVLQVSFIKGSPKGFAGEGKVILTESYAKKYFGDENPIGKELLWGDGTNIVQGVVPDPAEDSRYEYTMFFPIDNVSGFDPNDWGSQSVVNYFLANENFNKSEAEKELSRILFERMGPEMEKYFGVSPELLLEDNGHYEVFIEDFKDIYLYAEANDNFGLSGRIIFVYVFGIVAMLLIVLASINYINLSVAKSVKRLKEIALRKSIGATKKQIIVQYLVESVFLCVFSFFLSIALVELGIPYFNKMDLQTISISEIFHTKLFWLLFFVSIMVGLISGSFPAFVLSKFKMIEGLKGVSQMRTKGKWFKRGLVLFQLVISFFILASTFFINKQLEFLLNKDLGFNSEHIIYLKNANELYKKSNAVMQELQKHPNIVSATFNAAIPGQIVNGYTIQIEGQSADNLYNVHEVTVDSNYIKTFGIQLLEGRFLDQSMASDSNSVVVNEEFVKRFNIKNPLKTIVLAPSRIHPNKKLRMKVVGVVKNYHAIHLYSEIYPMLMNIHQPTWTQNLYIKVRPENTSETLAFLEDYWNEICPTVPFIYKFYDTEFKDGYKRELMTKNVFLVFAVIAIIIACLGLIGLVSYSSLLKRKEIGVRKVNGASTLQIAVLLSRETFIITLLAILLSTPLSVAFLTYWLKQFAYTISLPLIEFLIPALFLIFIALLAEVFIIISTARQNPVYALRYE